MGLLIRCFLRDIGPFNEKTVVFDKPIVVLFSRNVKGKSLLLKITTTFLLYAKKLSIEHYDIFKLEDSEDLKRNISFYILGPVAITELIKRDKDNEFEKTGIIRFEIEQNDCKESLTINIELPSNLREKLKNISREYPVLPRLFFSTDTSRIMFIKTLSSSSVKIEGTISNSNIHVAYYTSSLSTLYRLLISYLWSIKIGDTPLSRIIEHSFSSTEIIKEKIETLIKDKPRLFSRELITQFYNVINNILNLFRYSIVNSICTDILNTISYTFLISSFDICSIMSILHAINSIIKLGDFDSLSEDKNSGLYAGILRNLLRETDLNISIRIFDCLPQIYLISKKSRWGIPYVVLSDRLLNTILTCISLSNYLAELDSSPGRANFVMIFDDIEDIFYSEHIVCNIIRLLKNILDSKETISSYIIMSTRDIKLIEILKKEFNDNVKIIEI